MPNGSQIIRKRKVFECWNATAKSINNVLSKSWLIIPVSLYLAYTQLGIKMYNTQHMSTR